MTPRAIAFDLDGTLAESKAPVDRAMGTLLARLMEHMPIAIMSGGSYPQFTKQLLPALPTDAVFSSLYLFPVNAGMCYRYENGAWRQAYDHSFTEHERDAVLHALADAMEETGFTEPPSEVWGERIEDRGAQISFSALGQQAPVEAKKVWDPDRKKRQPLQEALLRRLPNFSVRSNAATTIDITKNGVTKSFGVREFSRLTDIPVNEMLYIGDGLFPGGNDDIVKETGIRTRHVTGPEQTAAAIEEILASL